MWRALGLDRHPDLRDDYFGNYTPGGVAGAACDAAARRGRARRGDAGTAARAGRRRRRPRAGAGAAARAGVPVEAPVAAAARRAPAAARRAATRWPPDPKHARAYALGGALVHRVLEHPRPPQPCVVRRRRRSSAAPTRCRRSARSRGSSDRRHRPPRPARPARRGRRRRPFSRRRPAAVATTRSRYRRRRGIATDARQRRPAVVLVPARRVAGAGARPAAAASRGLALPGRPAARRSAHAQSRGRGRIERARRADGPRATRAGRRVLCRLRLGPAPTSASRCCSTPSGVDAAAGRRLTPARWTRRRDLARCVVRRRRVVIDDARDS